MKMIVCLLTLFIVVAVVLAACGGQGTHQPQIVATAYVKPSAVPAIGEPTTAPAEEPITTDPSFTPATAPAEQQTPEAACCVSCLWENGFLPKDASIPSFQDLVCRQDSRQIVYGKGNLSSPAVIGDGYGNVGVYGLGSEAGVAGRAIVGPGVWGQGNPGVFGNSFSDYGVKGYSQDHPGGFFESGSDCGAWFIGGNGQPDVVLGGGGVLHASSLILDSSRNVEVRIDSDCDAPSPYDCASSQFSVRDSHSNDLLVVDKDGNATTRVLSAKQVTTAKVKTDVMEITGGSDLSEMFTIQRIETLPLPSAGMVVSIDPEHPGDLRISDQAYDRKVVGVVAGAGGIKPGILMGKNNPETMELVPVALTGRVYCWADASNSPIEPGDLLTTSNTPGHAMKVADHTKAQGAIIGKAMTGLDMGKGLVLVLVALQ